VKGGRFFPNRKLIVSFRNHHQKFGRVFSKVFHEYPKNVFKHLKFEAKRKPTIILFDLTDQA
jgi:hypothetical protein